MLYDLQMESIEIGEKRSNYIAPQSYNYETEAVMYLSARQKLICDTYIETMRIGECIKRAREKMGYKVSAAAIKRWFSYPNVRSYIEGRIKEEAMLRGYTKERFFMELIEYKNGIKKETRSTVLWMEMLRKSLKIGEGESVTVNNLQQINFTQGDGRP